MPTLLHILLVAYVGVQGADLAVTEHCLGAGSCRELNRVLAPLGSTPIAFGGAKMATAAASSWYLATQQHTHPRLALILAAAGTVVYTGVVVHNAHQLGPRR